MSNYKTLQIKLNLDDPFQKKIYDFVKEQTNNFSSFGKYLISNEMNRRMEKKEVELVETKNEIESLDSENFI